MGDDDSFRPLLPDPYFLSPFMRRCFVNIHQEIFEVSQVQHQWSLHNNLPFL